MVSTLLLLGLFVAVVVLAALATLTRLPYAILLVLGGLILGFMPGLPTITLNPDVVLLLFLPPLVYSSAWLTSWREFRASLQPILLLAVGLVLATTVVVALVAHAALGMSWSVAFVLGAVVSPTDAVAASATAQRLGLSRRLVTIIEGESIGLKFVGPLPEDIQNYTTYAAILAAEGAGSAAAREFVSYLTTPAAKKIFAAAGIK